MPHSSMSSRNDLERMGDRPSTISVIESCSLFNGVAREAKELLSAGSFLAFAERGEPIWIAGSPSAFAAVVASGFVKMTRTTGHGQEIIMELLGPGQCLGLFAAIEGRAFPLSAVAVTNCWYLKIPTPLALAVYRQSDALKDQIIRHLSPRLRRAHDMMARLSSGRVEERIAAVLFILADSYGRRRNNTLRIDVPLTRQDISEMAGTTVESAIRILSRWHKDGIVQTERHVITITKPKELEAILQA